MTIKRKLVSRERKGNTSYIDSAESVLLVDKIVDSELVAGLLDVGTGRIVNERLVPMLERYLNSDLYAVSLTYTHENDDSGIIVTVKVPAAPMIIHAARTGNQYNYVSLGGNLVTVNRYSK